VAQVDHLVGLVLGAEHLVLAPDLLGTPDETDLGALAVRPREGPPERGVSRRHDVHARTRGGRQLCRDAQVRRVVHGDHEHPIGLRDRDHPVALRVLPVDDQRQAVVEHEPVEVDERDPELLAERLVDLLLGHEVQLEEGVAEPEPGLLLMVQRDLELMLGDRLGLDEDVAQPVLLAIPVKNVVELALGDHALAHQDLPQRGRGLGLPLHHEGGRQLALVDQALADQDLAEKAATRLWDR
jgi:hypothetical protein